MPRVRLGFRRLYDAIGCSLAEGTEARASYSIGDGLSAEVYLGPRPRFGIAVTRSDKYFVLGEVGTNLLHAEFQSDASKSDYPRKFFAEVFCWKEVEVSDELYGPFQSNTPGAVQEVLRQARNLEDSFRQAVNLIAGAIGLRLHRQFALLMVNENLVAIRENGDFTHEMVGAGVEVLESVSLTAVGVEAIQALGTALGTCCASSLSRASTVLWWLMRAWAEHEPVSKFLAFFTPLEMVLEGYGGRQPETDESIEKSGT